MEREELSDGSYWSITDLSAASDGIFKMDLSIHQTFLSIVLSHDQDGNPRAYQETEESHIKAPTLELPGNMNRSAYSSAVHKWLHSLRLDIPLDDDLIWDFTFQLLASVSGTHDVHQNMAICVSAELHCLPIPIEKDDEEEYEPIEYEPDEDDPIMEDEEDDDDPIMEDEEDDDDPIMEDEEEYDPIEEDVEEDDGEGLLLCDLRAVVAAEEHRKLGDCLICLDPLFPVEEEDGNKYLFASPCGHYFHKDCMSEWLSRSDSCPLCRFDMRVFISKFGYQESE